MIADTKETISAFNLLAIKGALKLQIHGLKMRGVNGLSLARKASGIKARTAKEMLPLYEQWLREQGYLLT